MDIHPNKSPFEGSPPAASNWDEPRVDQFDYQAMCKSVFAPYKISIARIDNKQECHRIWSLMLSAMKGTHESMHALVKSAIEHEEETGEPTQRHLDACYLARPQWEAVHLSLLFAHKPEIYTSRYYKSGWAARICEIEFNALRMPDDQSRVAWRKKCQEWIDH